MLKTGNERLDRMPRQADLGAFIDVLDPAGHRLLRVGRGFDEEDPEKWFGEASTTGKSTLALYEPVAANDDLWQTLFFVCKTCRDQGLPFESRIDVVLLRQHLDAAWAEGKSNGETPTRHSVATSIDGDAIG